MPAMASEPPEGSSTVVSARRVRTDGMVKGCKEPANCTVKALSAERLETSVITLRLIRPSERTTGVMFRLTPNCLKSIVGWQTGGLVLVLQLRPAGTGN